MLRLIYISTILFMFSACTKVIDIDTENSEKKYVIEGIITNQAGGAKVLLTQTKNYNDDNDFPGVQGATVTISDNLGNSTKLAETSAGVYQSATLLGVEGVTYNLEVKIGTKTFRSSSTLPVEVGFDKLYTSDELWLGDTWKLANVEFRDPAGKKNYYFFRQLINGVKKQELYFFNDDYTDGNAQSIKLYMFPDTDDKEKIKKGDNIEVYMMCTDEHMYKYWFSAAQSATGGNQSAAPANPITNIEGGALGYFSAQTFSKKVVVAQ